MLVDYMSLNMLHQLITNSMDELLVVFQRHTDFLPSKSQLDLIGTENDETTNERDPEDPQVEYAAYIIPQT
ncbi:hypothetical protein NQ314_003964 [Rhamnusium bicolor]|uniref:Uncharacterized protein n=1 Tax=Rhamnusium bicolor TaxID=1586634 RepID=A0AAV8ZL00_9CUCU|nr:hypothetical protein NQ314_003964 [Rhamnusium bicolor]